MWFLLCAAKKMDPFNSILLKKKKKYQSLSNGFKCFVKRLIIDKIVFFVSVFNCISGENTIGFSFIKCNLKFFV